MNFKQLLNESPTDIVARFYKEASKDYDRYYNPEDVKYKDKNSEYYAKHFESWFNEGITPVFTKPLDKAQPEYNVAPKDGKLQSPGYRGLQYALAAAGLPYNRNVQQYKVNPQKLLAPQTMDSVRNSNGQ